MNSKKTLKVLASCVVFSSLLLSCSKAQYSPYIPPSTQNNDVFNNNPNVVNTTPLATGMGSVIGRVVDPSGKGLQNVAVSIKNVAVSTGYTGDFQVNNVPAGSQTILFTYGSRQISLNVNVVADSAVSPELNPIQFSNNGTGGSGIANTQLKTFLVDQDFLNQWQAKSVAVMNGVIYVAAIDQKGWFTQKGTIISMDSEAGKTWTDLGAKWLKTRHPMDKSLQAVGISSSNLVAVDTAGSVYNIESGKSVVSYKSGGGTDIAIGGGSVYIVNGSSVEKTDTTGQARTAVKNLTVSGGICSDGTGNLFAVSGKTIKKATFSSIDTTVVDIIKDGLVAPTDVAVDDKSNFIYVLDGSDIKRFSAEGVLLSTFGTSCVKAVSICVDETGYLYVADEGKDYKTSKIVKFAPGNNVIPMFQNQDYVKAMQNFDGVSSDTTTDTTTDTTN